MFGGQDDSARPGAGSGQDDTLNGVTDLVGGAAAPTDSTPPSNDAAGSGDGGFMPAPSEPVQSSVPAPTEEAENVVSEPETPAPAEEPSPAPSAPAPADDAADELLDLKQQALQQLSPLVGHLEQTPEEKFRTTMMLIQASDNQSLLKDAYEAARAIGDEKVRAQALLDVINEINYFTQNQQQS